MVNPTDEQSDNDVDSLIDAVEGKENKTVTTIHSEIRHKIINEMQDNIAKTDTEK